MAITTRPAATFEATLTGAPSGLVGTLGVQILDNIGGVSLARSTAGIIETPAGSGLYAKTLTAPAVAGQYTILWDTGTITPTTTATEDLTITASLVAGPATTYYCLPDDLRAELAVTSTTLTDQAAVKLIRTAEDLIDEDLGAWIVNPTTGRKILQGSVDAWRFTKLSRATVLLAKLLHDTPDASTPGKQFDRVKGPDFEYWGPRAGSALGGGRFGPMVDTPLNQSGLRRMTTRVGGRRGGAPPWWDFVVNDTSWDYDPAPLPRQPG